MVKYSNQKGNILEFIKKIDSEINFEKKFTFCTLVTKLDEYLEMVDSAQKKGFCGDVEFIYFENINSNQSDGYSGINRAVKEAKGEYLIFCHQDIIFHSDDRNLLEEKLKELNEIDPKWALAGNAGINVNGQTVLRISDPNGEFQSKGEVPSIVSSLDENFIILNQRVNNSCSYKLNGYHLYGIDLCFNAGNLGLKSYVIDFNLYHKSKGNKNKDFLLNREKSINFYAKNKQKIVFCTVCTIFFVTEYDFLNKILNTSLFKKIYFLIKGKR